MFAATILKIDLEEESVDRLTTREYAHKDFPGRTVNFRLLDDHYAEISKGADPFSILLFGVGPLAGTLFPGASTVSVVGQTSDTGEVVAGVLGGGMGTELKNVGYEQLMLTGIARTLSYLYIHNDFVEIRDAGFVKGKGINEVEKLIRQDLDDEEVEVVAIGPAGENRESDSVIQCCITGLASGPMLGSVMGSMNLKAIAVHGNGKGQVAEPGKFFECCSRIHVYLQSSSLKRDFLEEIDERVRDFSNNYGIGKVGCYGCPLPCCENYDHPTLGAGVISRTIFSKVLQSASTTDLFSLYEYFNACQESGLDPVSFADKQPWKTHPVNKSILSEESMFAHMMGICPNLADHAMSCVSIERYAEALSYGVGKQITGEELLQQLERTQALERKCLAMSRRR